MFFYRRPMWGIGFKILMIFLLISGGTMIARSAFQAGVMQGAAAEGAEFTIPYFAPHFKGYHPLGGSFFTILAIFFGGVLLIKLITSIVGLVMYRRWKADGSEDWNEIKGWGYRNFHHPFYHRHCHPAPWEGYPMKGRPDGKAASPEGEEEKTS